MGQEVSKREIGWPGCAFISRVSKFPRILSFWASAFPPPGPPLFLPDPGPVNCAGFKESGEKSECCNRKGKDSFPLSACINVLASVILRASFEVIRHFQLLLGNRSAPWTSPTSVWARARVVPELRQRELYYPAFTALHFSREPLNPTFRGKGKRGSDDLGRSVWVRWLLLPTTNLSMGVRRSSRPGTNLSFADCRGPCGLLKAQMSGDMCRPQERLRCRAERSMLAPGRHLFAGLTAPKELPAVFRKRASHS